MKYTLFFNEKGDKELGFWFEDGIVPFIDCGIAHDASSAVFTDEELSRFNEVYKDIKDGKRAAVKKSFKAAPLVLSKDANVFCVGRNYASTYADMNKATDKKVERLERPAFFYKPNRAVNPTEGIIEFCREDTVQLDYEGEIGVVLGKGCKNISASDAENVIYGFTAANDVSARDAMKAYYQMYKGKSMDGFAPIGPCIATKDEIADQKDINIETRVNGELRQKGNTSDFIFTFAEIISYLSRSMTLMPGDIIFTGTPSGIGAAMDPPVFLKDGDKIEITVEGIGTLVNYVHEYTK